VWAALAELFIVCYVGAHCPEAREWAERGGSSERTPEEDHALRCAPKREGREGRPPGRPAQGGAAGCGSTEAESL